MKFVGFSQNLHQTVAEDKLQSTTEQKLNLAEMDLQRPKNNSPIFATIFHPVSQLCVLLESTLDVFKPDELNFSATDRKSKLLTIETTFNVLLDSIIQLTVVCKGYLQLTFMDLGNVLAGDSEKMVTKIELPLKTVKSFVSWIFV